MTDSAGDVPDADGPATTGAEGRPGPVGLVATGLALSRGGRIVLRGASLTVPPGRVTALLAPSGAGKSTLLRCLVRLLDPDEGTVTLDGVATRTLDPRVLRRRVGFVAQRPVMFDGTVGANVGHGLEAGPGRDHRIHAALEAAGLPSGWTDRTARDQSGGEQARVAIARALVLEPAFLLLDEPTAALDEAAAEHLGRTLRGLAEAGIGVVVATHDRRFAARYTDRAETLGSPT